MPKSKNDPFYAEALEARQAFGAGIMGADEALVCIWAAMRSAADAGFPASRYVELSDAVGFDTESDDELDAEIVKAWK